MCSVRDLPMLCAGGAADVRSEQQRRAEMTIKGGSVRASPSTPANFCCRRHLNWTEGHSQQR